MRGIYRFIDRYGNIIYIGKASNINNRLKDGRHRGTGHLPKHAYDEVVKIEFTAIENKNDLKDAEKYFITKLNPKYNTQYTDYNPPTSNAKWDCVRWNPYWTRDMVEYELDLFIKEYERTIDSSTRGNALVLDIDMSIEEFALATVHSNLKWQYECYLKGIPHCSGVYKHKETGEWVTYSERVDKSKYFEKCTKIYKLIKNVEQFFTEFRIKVWDEYPNILVTVDYDKFLDFYSNSVQLNFTVYKLINREPIYKTVGFLKFKD